MPNPVTVDSPLPQTTPDNISTPLQPTPKKTSWLLIFLIVFLLSSTGLLGYKYYELKQQLDNQSQPTPLPSPQLMVSSPSPVISPNTEVDPTAGWKTYKNTKYGFKMKVPSDFNISAPTDKLNEGLIGVNNLFNLYFNDRRQQEINQINNTPEHALTIQPQELPSFNFINKNYPVKKMIFGEGTPSRENCLNNFVASTYLIDVSDHLMIISIPTKSEFEECNGQKISQKDNFDTNIPLVKTILSTFEFID